MAVSTVNISFQDDLLQKIDQIARVESRSRSELLREAARMYIERKQRWAAIFSYSKEIAGKTQLSEDDILNEIKAHRTSKK